MSNRWGAAWEKETMKEVAKGIKASISLRRRDKFAAMAMQGMWAAQAHPMAGGIDEDSLQRITKYAVLSADALVAELDKESE